MMGKETEKKEKRTIECGRCHGLGMINCGEPCPRCQGKGTITEL